MQRVRLFIPFLLFFTLSSSTTYSESKEKTGTIGNCGKAFSGLIGQSVVRLATISRTPFGNKDIPDESIERLLTKVGEGASAIFQGNQNMLLELRDIHGKRPPHFFVGSKSSLLLEGTEGVQGDGRQSIFSAFRSWGLGLVQRSSNIGTTYKLKSIKRAIAITAFGLAAYFKIDVGAVLESLTGLDIPGSSFLSVESIKEWLGESFQVFANEYGDFIEEGAIVGGSAGLLITLGADLTRRRQTISPTAEDVANQIQYSMRDSGIRKTIMRQIRRQIINKVPYLNELVNGVLSFFVDYKFGVTAVEFPVGFSSLDIDRVVDLANAGLTGRYRVQTHLPDSFVERIRELQAQ